MTLTRLIAVLLAPMVALPAAGQFGITFDFEGTLSSGQQVIFQEAADTWEGYITGYQDEVTLDGITITEERAEQVDFSDPYLRSEQFMLVGAGEDRFDTAEEFAAQEDLLIGSQAGTTNFYVAVYDVLDGDEDAQIKSLVKYVLSLGDSSSSRSSGAGGGQQ